MPLACSAGARAREYQCFTTCLRGRVQSSPTQGRCSALLCIFLNAAGRVLGRSQPSPIRTLHFGQRTLGTGCMTVGLMGYRAHWWRVRDRPKGESPRQLQERGDSRGGRVEAKFSFYDQMFVEM